jgi:hypothetical protein
MVNKAILEYLGDAHSAETVDAVRARAGCEQTHFTSMLQYPDEMSFGLIAAAAEILGQPADSVLEQVGEYWVGFALRSDYGDLLRMAGRTLPEVVQNLNQLHTRVGEAFVDLKPPSFWCDEVTASSLVLHYASDREGLGPMVIGLVRGLGHMLGVETSVAATAAEPGEPIEFVVQFVARGETGKSRVPQPAASEDTA